MKTEINQKLFKIQIISKIKQTNQRLIVIIFLIDRITYLISLLELYLKNNHLILYHQKHFTIL